MEEIYNKLVRDKIPEIIESNGENPVYLVLSDEQYKVELENKSLDDIIEIAYRKREKRGGFDKKIFLQKVGK